MLNGDYIEAQKIAERIASEMDPPRFYFDKKEEVEASRHLYNAHPMVKANLEIVEKRADRFGHGLSHVRKVAIDAGALVIIENGGIQALEKVKRMVLLAHLAGVLHDIRREEKEHALRGAEEAEGILKTFHLNETERSAIVHAIRNHEAFKPAQALDDSSQQLLSDALYDADKFRWGPDNFTETVWMMVAPMNVPMKALLKRFLPGMKGIEKIKETFRTRTGKEYGPDFISRGLEIGMKLYSELTKIHNPA